MANLPGFQTGLAQRAERSLIHQTRHLHALVRQRLWLQVLIGMTLGFLAGMALGPTAGIVPPDIGAQIAHWLALPGDVFLAIIKFVVVPLVLASVVRGIAAGEDTATLKRLGSRVLLFFVVTTAAAVVIGCGVALWLKPGLQIDASLLRASLGQVPQAIANAANSAAEAQNASLPEKVVSILPQNLFADLASGDMLQIVIGAAIFGAALLMVPTAQAKPFFDLMGSIQAASMVVVRWVMMFAPIAVFGLIAEITTLLGPDAILGMGAYVGTVLLGLFILLLVYLALAAGFGGRAPLPFMKAVREAMLLAFSTSSSAAVMPLSLRTAQDKLLVRDAVARLVIPLGATINMAGTALYQGTAAIFLAQVFGIDIGVPGLLLITITAVGTSIGSPGTPGVGIVILATILTSVGIPPEGIALILGVDRLLDMCRTSVNVMGDLVACVVMERLLARRNLELAGAETKALPPAEGSGAA